MSHDLFDRHLVPCGLPLQCGFGFGLERDSIEAFAGPGCPRTNAGAPSGTHSDFNRRM